MGRLKGLSSRLSPLRSRVPHLSHDRQTYDRRRDEQPWRKWYKTARWQALRWSVLVRDRFTCQRPGCGRIEPDTSLLVADHKRAHRGDEALFWDECNLQTLCKPCHDSDKQREEHRSGR
ncbi:hypothetical protein SAMN05192583_1394 [Sphingomonas gellani]|uniref:HNH nuclease domain-containing protein n=1 Tax=Sphingomonas gellani TaxID=1166340 RepID=A0A1H8C0F6_9SPHN|nr:HNH endonuclease [Sphingomonas gellani]SEM88349.1 hypothetical protein SAMN05192583_1394 [Sphingomonas gellani]